MSVPVIEFEQVAPAPRRAGTASPRRINDAFAWFAIVIVALTPIPFGSNPPFFWTASAFVLGIGASVYALALARRGAALRFPWRATLAFSVPFGFVCLWLVVQMLPIGGVVFATPSGETVPSRTLSLAPGATGLMLLRLVSYGLFFFLVLQMAVNADRARFMLAAIFVVLVGFAVLGVLLLTQFDDTILGIRKWAYFGSATATFVNRNSYATFLAFGLVLGTVLLLGRFAGAEGDEERPRAPLIDAPNLLLVAGMAMIGAALIATQSRMGFFAGVLASVLVLLVGALKLRLRARAWALVGLGLAAGLGAVLFLYGGGLFERISGIESDADVRGALYAQVLDMIGARPLLGYGGGSFEAAFPLFHRLPVNADVVWDKAHSTYLTLWTELGIVAGSVPLLILFGMGIGCARTFMRRRRTWQPALAGLGVLTVAGVHSLVDFSLEIQANAYAFLAVLAIAVASGHGAGRRDGGAP